MVRLGLVIVVVACGGARPADRPAPPLAPFDHTGSPQLVVRIPEDWNDVATEASWVVAGTIATATKPDGINQYCLSPSQVVLGSSLSTRVCTDVGKVVGRGDHDQDPIPNARGWAVLDRDRQIIATARDACAEPPCREPPRDALVINLRCGRLAQLWSTLPEPHVRCTADADCQLLTSTCFAASVRIDAAAPYLEVVRRWGGVCTPPDGGMCPAVRYRAACRANRCAFEQA